MGIRFHIFAAARQTTRSLNTARPPARRGPAVLYHYTALRSALYALTACCTRVSACKASSASCLHVGQMSCLGTCRPPSPSTGQSYIHLRDAASVNATGAFFAYSHRYIEGVIVAQPWSKK